MFAVGATLLSPDLLNLIISSRVYIRSPSAGDTSSDKVQVSDDKESSADSGRYKLSSKSSDQAGFRRQVDGLG